MKKTIWILLLMCFIGGTSYAQLPGGDKQEKKSDLNAKVPLDNKVRYGKLDNGFTYYVRDNKKPENKIQFRLVSNAGSILEREDQRGLAHFCEHMCFNGIKGYPHNEMIDKLQQHGVEFGRGINAYTSFDQTVYYCDMPADDPEMVKMGMEILDGWAGNVLFDSIELEEERGVIHEEWRGNTGAGDRIRKKTWPVMLKGSLYAERLPIGLESVIMGFKRQSIVDFYNDWYRPDLQAVVIVGDLGNFEYKGMKGAKAMEQQVKDIFGAKAATKNPKHRPSFEIPGNIEPLITIATDPELTSTSVSVFWKHKKAHEGLVGDYRQMIVRNLIGKMIDDRFNEMCEKPTVPMMYAGAGYGGFLGREIDVFSASTTPKEGRIEEATKLLLSEMKRLAQHGFLQAELDRQKEDLLSWYTKMAKEENKTQSNSLADEYTDNYLEGVPAPGIRQEWKYAKEFLPEISLYECNRLMADWITDNNIVFMLTAPEKIESKLPTENDVREWIKNMRELETEPWVDTYKDEPLFTQDVKDATPKVTKENKVLDYKEYTCPNGIKFIVKKTEYKADEIQIGSFAFGGTSLYNDKDVYNAQNATKFIDEGIGNFNASQLEKKLKGKNLSISPYISDETQGFSGNCSPKDLETTLQLINLYYTAPRKDKDAFDRNIENTLNQIKFINDNPQVEFIKTYYKTAYPNDKRTVVVPTEEKVKSLNLDKMYQIYKERFKDATAQTFFFVGNVSDDDIALIAKYLNNLPTGKQKAEKYKDCSAKFASGIKHATATKGIENKGMLIINGETVVKGKIDQRTRIILQQLSDCIDITTTQIIREKNGDAYSPQGGCNFSLMPKSTVSYQYYIGLDPEKAEKVEKDAIDILRQYQEQGPDAKTLAKVQEQQIVNRDAQRQNNGFWMGQLQGSYIYNESRDDVEKYNEIVKSITAAEIQAAAKKYFNLNNYVAVKLVPEKKAEEAK